jgi:peptidoglycan hydrolase-like protein with peptidoglycan-binding domain
MALSWPLEEQGSTGENVRSIQYLLNAHMSASASEAAASSAEAPSATGSESGGTATLTEAPSTTATDAPPSTAATTAAAPQALVVDGIFGPLTAAAVRSFQAAHGLTVDGKVGNQTWPVLIIEVQTGNTGDAVRAVQSQLTSRSSWLTIDGIFGPQTNSVVRSFQTFCAFSVDGIVGPITWNGLTLPWVRADGGQPAAQLAFAAWSKNDRTDARYEATPAGVDALFSRAYQTGWTFEGCGVAAGTFVCTWERSGTKLLLEGNDDTGAPFFYINNVTTQT